MARKFQKQKEGMVDIGAKPITRRVAVAIAEIRMSRIAFEAFLHKRSPKGDVLETAKVAGIMAAKLTPQIIPMCHPLELNKVRIRHSVNKSKRTIQLMAEVVCDSRTGVEMEALTAVSVAALTVYDMMKWADKSMVISNVKLMHKSGGKSGDFTRTQP